MILGQRKELGLERAGLIFTRKCVLHMSQTVVTAKEELYRPKI